MVVGNPRSTSNSNNVSEEIDERILRLLGLEDIFDLDYDTYLTLLKEAMVKGSFGKNKISDEELAILANERKRVRGNKGRFQVKTKKINISNVTGGVGGIKKIASKDPISPQKLLPPSVDIAEKGKVLGDEFENNIAAIRKSVESIANILSEQLKFQKKIREQDRKESEGKRRADKETALEKSLKAVQKVVSGLLAPVKSIWESILNFFINVLLGRIVLKLVDWFADPKNQSKIQSIIRFLGDHWPTLLALYLRFGTGLGKFVGKLTKVLIKGTIKLIALAAKLAAKAGLKKFAGAARFLGGPRGAALATGLGIAADVAITAGVGAGVSNLAGGGGEEKTPPTQEFSGGGSVRYPKFAGGGFANFGNMFKGAGFGSMFGPMGMLLGAALGSGKPQEMFEGLINGKKGKDKVPAMLTDGEFVMSVGAVKKYGVDTLEAMNAAGGGTNIPQIAKGITYAAGGGMIGDAGAAQQAWTNYMNLNPEKFARGGAYGTADSVNQASRDFMRTFVKTGKPPTWANINQRTTRVSSTNPTRPNVNNNVNVDYKPPSSSSIVRSQPGALSTNVKPPVQRINTNMNVPGGRIRGGSLSAVLAAFEMKQRMDEGQTATQAGLGAGGAALGGQLGWMAGAKAGAIAGAALGSIVPGLGTGVGAAVGAIVGGLAAGYGGAMLGGKLADDLSGVNAAKERMNRGGIGGAVRGGYGLRGQSFKDAPKTMVMTDDKGRPFVGHKAMRNGKLTYVRPPTPGTGTTNPLEAIGRFVNPGAYKENDQRVAMKNQKIAMVNALESFQRQGMAPDAQARMMKQMGGNLKDVQNDLNYRKKRGDLIRQGKLKPDGTPYTAQERMRMSISGSQRNSRSNSQAQITRSRTAASSATKAPPAPKSNVVVIRRNTRGGGQTVSTSGGGSRANPPSIRAQSPSRTTSARASHGIK